MPAHFAREDAPRPTALLRTLGLEKLPETGERELRVDRHETSGQSQDGVDRQTILEGVLQLEMIGGEHLLQERAERDLPQPAADFRSLENLLQTADVLAQRENLLTALPDFAQPEVDVRDQSARVGAGSLQGLGVFGQAARDLPRQLAEGDADVPGDLRAELRDLLGQTHDLVLQEGDRQFGCLGSPATAAQESHAEDDDGHDKDRQEGANRWVVDRHGPRNRPGGMHDPPGRPGRPDASASLSAPYRGVN